MTRRNAQCRGRWVRQCRDASDVSTWDDNNMSQAMMHPHSSPLHCWYGQNTTNKTLRGRLPRSLSLSLSLSTLHGSVRQCGTRSTFPTSPLPQCHNPCIQPHTHHFTVALSKQLCQRQWYEGLKGQEYASYKRHTCDTRAISMLLHNHTVHPAPQPFALLSLPPFPLYPPLTATAHYRLQRYVESTTFYRDTCVEEERQGQLAMAASD